MIDQQSPPPRVAPVEAVPARRLVELSGRQYFVTGLPWHATHRSSHVDGAEAERPAVAESSAESAACVDDEVVPERYVSFGRLVEAGAGHLAAASAAYREQCRQAAVQARELAAFAADNDRLRGYYRERGFVELVRREFRDWGPVMLLEKPLI